MSLRVFDPQQVLRKQLTEAAMRFTDALGCLRAAAFASAFVNPQLHFDMGFGFCLQVAFLRIVAVFAFQRGRYRRDGCCAPR
jgi:hypothetical protein